MARVIADGKITVPRRVRDALQSEKGDYLVATITEVIKMNQKHEEVKRRKKPHLRAVAGELIGSLSEATRLLRRGVVSGEP